MTMVSLDLGTVFFIWSPFFLSDFLLGQTAPRWPPCTKFPARSRFFFWPNNKHCYYFVGDVRKVGVATARSLCHNANAYLATVRSEEELHVLTWPDSNGFSLIPPDGTGVWLGMMKNASTAYEWAWEDREGLHLDDPKVTSLTSAAMSQIGVTSDNAVLRRDKTWLPESNLPEPKSSHVLCEDSYPAESYGRHACYMPGLLDNVIKPENLADVKIYFDAKHLRCYYYIDLPTGWTDALKTCSQVPGLRMMWLESEQETKFFANEVLSRHPRQDAWIGLSKVDLEWRWRTRTSSTGLAVTQWSSTPETAHRYAYLKMDTRQWGSTANNFLPFVCEESLLQRFLNYLMCDTAGPQDKSFYFTRTQTCYVFYSTTVSYTDAQTLCSQTGGHLVWVTSDDMKSFLMDTLYSLHQSVPGIWLGLRYDNTMTWVWEKENDKEELGPYTDWKEPSDATPTYEHVVMTQTGWIQAPPSSKYQTVCQVPIKDKDRAARNVCGHDKEAQHVILNLDRQSCYYYHMTAEIFSEANRKCQDTGNHLFIPETAREQEDVWTALGEKGLDQRVWLGLKKLGSGLWVWLDKNGVKTIFDSARFPNSGTLQSAHALTDENGALIPAPPGTRAPFLCEARITPEDLQAGYSALSSGTTATLSATTLPGTTTTALPTTTDTTATTTPDTTTTATSPTTPTQYGFHCSSPSPVGQLDASYFKRVLVLRQMMSALSTSRRSSAVACGTVCAQSRLCHFYIFTTDRDCWTFQPSTRYSAPPNGIGNCSVNKCYQRPCEMSTGGPV